jgi:hypothetical protein
MNGKQVKNVSTIDVLRFQQEWWEDKRLPYAYERFPNMPQKVVYRKMEKLVVQGFLEYGVSLRTSWLTDKAKKLLYER